MGRSRLILLDTHVLLWLISDFDRLSSRATREVQRAREHGDTLAISSISLVEVASLSSKGRIELAMPLEVFLQSLELSFTVLPITSKACARTVDLPEGYPGDPADRIIGATALVEGMTLITADQRILESKAVPAIW